MNSNQKGKRGEREFCNLLKAHGIKARRSQQYCGIRGDADIISDLENIHWEIKRVQNLQLSKALAQATSDAGEKIPIVAHRKNGEDWLVTFTFKNWIGMVNICKLMGEDYSMCQ